MLYLPGAESLLTSVSTSGVASDWRLGRFESRGACCPSSQILFALRFLIWNVASSQTEPGALRRRASWEQLLVQGIRALRFSSRLSSTPLRAYISALINVHTQALVARGAQIDSQSVDARSQAREMPAKERLCVFDFARVDLKERGGGRGDFPLTSILHTPLCLAVSASLSVSVCRCVWILLSPSL